MPATILFLPLPVSLSGQIKEQFGRGVLGLALRRFCLFDLKLVSVLDARWRELPRTVRLEPTIWVRECLFSFRRENADYAMCSTKREMRFILSRWDYGVIQRKARDQKGGDGEKKKDESLATDEAKILFIYLFIHVSIHPSIRTFEYCVLRVYRSYGRC